MAQRDVIYDDGEKITNDMFPYEWYYSKSEGFLGTADFCELYKKSEMLQPPKKIISQDPYRVIPFGPSVKEGKVTVEASLQWSSSSSITNTTSLELGVKAMAKVAEASATFKNETSTTRTLGRNQKALFRAEYAIGPRHLVEVFIDKWKVNTRFHITKWKRGGKMKSEQWFVTQLGGTLGLIAANYLWHHPTDFFDRSGEKRVEDCEYTLDSWPRIIALPIGDEEGFKEMNEKQRSFAFKFNWMRFAKNVIGNYFGTDKVANLKPGMVEKVVLSYYDETKPVRSWPEFRGDLEKLVL